MKTQSTTPPPPAGRKGLALGAFVVAATLLALSPVEQSQAQVYIDIFPSQDNANQTLWLFSGSIGDFWTFHNSNPTIRTSGHYARGDTAKTSNAFFPTGTTTTSGSNHALTPLFTATATNAPLDFESLRTRLGQTIKLGTTNTNDDITIPSTATNTPTLTVSSRGSRTIANMYLRDNAGSVWDDIGPRVNSNLDYRDNNNNARYTFSWTGAGVMNKPISHFNLTTAGSYNGNRAAGSESILGGFPGGGQANELRIRVHGAVIPEPEEYALIFALFALGFVFFHRRMQKKKRCQGTTL